MRLKTHIFRRLLNGGRLTEVLEETDGADLAGDCYKEFEGVGEGEAENGD